MKTLLYVFTFFACCMLITVSSCKKDSKCDNVNCGTQGTCNEETGNCDCNEGWEGTLCDSEIISSICDTLNCGEYGVCNEETGECDCQDGWTGSLCDVQTMACDTLDCGDHGTCNPDTKMCDCEDGWQGLLCDEVDLCFEVDCTNGDCDPATGECICEDGWMGEMCDEADNCFGIECANGECDPETGMCDCPDGWTGELCEEVDLCFGVECVNGDCDPETGECICEDGWEGANCNKDVSACGIIDCGNGTCIVTNGIASCECEVAPDGSALYASGSNCKDCIAFGGPCPDNSTCTLGGCQCDDGYVFNNDFTECVSPQTNDENAEMYWGEYLQTDELYSDSIDPTILVDYALVTIVPNGGISNQLWLNNVAALGDGVLAVVQSNPRFFEIPEQITLDGHYFKGLEKGTFLTAADSDTIATIKYTLTPFGGLPDTCDMVLRKL